ncbi:hypothetical protein DHEL01_v211152 [Diaporthe helianthi]|uniref:DNA2/NAM7 helicase-like C-terminal domain-containing protein n=1 Tax=Diaporthe helianthi TaxID=158607 RepID=A0A2P5HJN0_DIAHE|nr:hypothetical protein DHEL01_v211152 [Diaporthe helianthi]
MAYFNDDSDWDARDWDSDYSVDEIPAVRPNAPKYLFTSPREFANRHGRGTEAEFQLEKALIKSFNRKLRVFYAWPIIILGKDGAQSNWLFFVQLGADDSMLPKEGDTCLLKIPSGNITYEETKDGEGGKRFHRNTKFLHKQALRVDNPCSLWGIKDEFWARAMAFEVTLPNPTRNSPVKPIIDAETAEKGFNTIPRPKGFERQVTFELRLSSSTHLAELGALEEFKEATKRLSTQLSSEMKYRRLPFKYLMNFTPQNYISLFDAFPHLMNPLRRPQTVPKELVKMFEGMDAHQKAAYAGLDRIPNRICFVPGGSAALQSQHKTDTAEEPDAPVLSRNQVLYLVDINRSATDVANKLVETYKKLGLQRYVIRMYCWSDEMGSVTVNMLETQKQELYHRIACKRQKENPENNEGGQLGEGPLAKYDKNKDQSDKVRIRRMALSTLKVGNIRSKSHYKGEKESRRAPTLEEAVMAYFEEHKDTRYAELHDLCHIYNEDLQALRCQLVDKQVRGLAQLIVDPKLVIFDEAPHARELTIMIPIAKFCPEAWVFTGDHRQTKPYVGSHGLKRTVNKHVLQLRTSTMERAFKANPNMLSLLTNHRACGGLQEPASALFYSGKMVPAVKPGTPGAIPPSTEHLRKTYIMPLKASQKKQVSRMLVVLEGFPFDREESRIQGSLCNENHQDWVKELVEKLVRDPKFLQTNGKDRGTILIMSPYKRAVIEYGKMISVIKGQRPSGLDGCIVEARTVDTAQGFEADVVILDFVSDWVTKHLQDPNRLCVAITRARQAEFIIMHPEMVNKLGNLRQFEDSPLADLLAECIANGQFARVPGN